MCNGNSSYDMRKLNELIDQLEIFKQPVINHFVRFGWYRSIYIPPVKRSG